MTAPSLTFVEAKPLSSEECALLREQKQQFEAKGMAKTISRGAKWASENLDAQKISEVGEFLSVVEKISFRCNSVAKKKKKSKTGGLGNVPLPVRNSRRVQQKSVKDLVKVNSSTPIEGTLPLDESAGLTPAEKAVISTITDASKPARNDKVPALRKTLEK